MCVRTFAYAHIAGAVIQLKQTKYACARARARARARPLATYVNVRLVKLGALSYVESRIQMHYLERHPLQPKTDALFSRYNVVGRAYDLYHSVLDLFSLSFDQDSMLKL